MFKFSSFRSLEMLKTRINGGIYMTQTTIGRKINWIKFDFCERFRKMIEKKCSVIVNAFNTFCRFMIFSVSINLSASCDRRRALLLWHFNKCLSQQAMKRQIRMKIFAFAKPDKIFVAFLFSKKPTVEVKKQFLTPNCRINGDRNKLGKLKNLHQYFSPFKGWSVSPLSPQKFLLGREMAKGERNKWKLVLGNLNCRSGLEVFN